MDVVWREYLRGLNAVCLSISRYLSACITPYKKTHHGTERVHHEGGDSGSWESRVCFFSFFVPLLSSSRRKDILYNK